MPYISEVTADGTGLHRIGRGVVTGAEMLEAGQQLAKRTDQLSMLNHVFIDFSEATSIDVYTQEIQQVCTIHGEDAKVFKRAFVAIAAPSDLAYGTGRMYAGYLRIPGWEVEVFRSRKEAQEWLVTKLC